MNWTTIYTLTDYGEIPIIHDDIFNYIKMIQRTKGLRKTPFRIITIPNTKKIEYIYNFENALRLKIISDDKDTIIIPINTYSSLLLSTPH